MQRFTRINAIKRNGAIGVISCSILLFVLVLFKDHSESIRIWQPWPSREASNARIFKAKLSQACRPLLGALGQELMFGKCLQ